AGGVGDKDERRRMREGIWNPERWGWIMVVDEDCNVGDGDEVMWRVAAGVEPERDTIMGKVNTRRQLERGEVDFNPPSRGIGIDATMKFKDAKFPSVNKVSSALMDKVAARWDEFGLP